MLCERQHRSPALEARVICLLFPAAGGRGFKASYLNHSGHCIAKALWSAALLLSRSQKVKWPNGKFVSIAGHYLQWTFTCTRTCIYVTDLLVSYSQRWVGKNHSVLFSSKRNSTWDFEWKGNYVRQPREKSWTEAQYESGILRYLLIYFNFSD